MSKLPIPVDETYWGVPKKIEEAKSETKIVSSNYYREAPEGVSFKQLLEYHDKTPQIQLAVSSYSELITGTEIQINADDKKAQEIIEEWIRATGFYDKFEGLVTTILICGNGILEKLDEDDTQDVIEVDMTGVQGKKRDQYGNLEYYEAYGAFGNIQKLGENNIDKFIEFNLTQYSRQAWGRSLFHSLAVTRSVGNRVTMPLVEMMWSIEDAMGAIVINHAYPLLMFTYENANPEELSKQAEKLRNFKPGDKFVQTKKPAVDIYETQGNSKYTDFITHLEKTFELGTQFPHDIMTGDFTSRASSETTETIVMKRVRGFQRYLCNKLKTELFDPILAQRGIDPSNANLTVSFSTQNIIEMDITQMNFLMQSGAVSRDEVREWLKTNTSIDLFDDKTIQQAPVSRFGDSGSDLSFAQVEKVRQRQIDILALEERKAKIALYKAAREKIEGTPYMKFKEDSEITDWITVNGNHIPIKKDQSKNSAVSDFLTQKTGFKHEPGQKINIKTEDIYSKQTMDDLKTTWNETPEEHRKLVKKLTIDDEFSDDGNTGGLYSGRDNSITLYGVDNPYDEENLKFRLTHETGHAVADKIWNDVDHDSIDAIMNNSPPLNDLVDKDVLSANGYKPHKFKDEVMAEFYAVDRYHQKHGNFDDYYQTVNEETYQKLKQVFSKNKFFNLPSGDKN